MGAGGAGGRSRRQPELLHQKSRPRWRGKACWKRVSSRAPSRCSKESSGLRANWRRCSICLRWMGPGCGACGGGVGKRHGQFRRRTSLRLNRWDGSGGASRKLRTNRGAPCFAMSSVVAVPSVARLLANMLRLSRAARPATAHTERVLGENILAHYVDTLPEISRGASRRIGARSLALPPRRVPRMTGPTGVGAPHQTAWRRAPSPWRRLRCDSWAERSFRASRANGRRPHRSHRWGPRKQPDSPATVCENPESCGRTATAPRESLPARLGDRSGIAA